MATRPGQVRRGAVAECAGDEDPFQPGDQAFAGALGNRASTHLTWPGGHDDSYWNAHWPAYARFYTRALSRCAR